MGVLFAHQYWRNTLKLFSVWVTICLWVYAPLASAQESLTEQQQIAQEERQAQQQLIKSLLSLSETFVERREHLDELNTDLGKAEEEAQKTTITAEIETLTEEILLVQSEIDLIVLGLQAQQYSKDNGEVAPVDIKKEIGRVFEPIVFSLERATEPARRMEELRKLSEQARARVDLAQDTLLHLKIFDIPDSDYPKDVQERLDRYKGVWESRLQEAQGLADALDEQFLSAQRVNRSSVSQFGKDFAGFIINRGASILLALGLAFGFALLCQALRMAISRFYRKRHGGVLSAAMRVIAMALSFIGVLGGFLIALSIFNMRHDWLLLAMGLLLGLGVSWTFVRSLPSFIEQSRVLLNLGAVREGERTVINGLPYKIERLGMYSKLVNPDIKGGALTYPVRELIGMHSRPVIDGEAWFPTKIGDWILRHNNFFEVIDQTPEHVILRKGSGAEDFVPVSEFLSTEFELISNGYTSVYNFGLGYQYLSDAREIIPEIIDAKVRERIAKELGDDALLNVMTRFVALGDSALSFKILAVMGSGHGSMYGAMQKFLNRAVVDACLEHNWEIPFPQLVVHKGT